MIGCALALGAIGFLIARRARRRCGSWGGGGWGGYHRGWHQHMSYMGGRGDGWLRFVSHELDTTPAQERVIQREVGQLVERARDTRRNVTSGRADIARAVGSPVFDESAAQAGFAPVKQATDELGTAAVESLRKIHEVLDDEQRKQLAELIEGGRWRFGRGGGGPYR